MIRIIADTTCGVPVPVLKSLGIEVLPQIVTFGNQAYRDDIEIDTPEFLSKLRSSAQLPGTAAPPPAMYTPLFKRILQAGDSALVITPSQLLSGTFRSSCLAAEEFKSPSLQVVDTQTIAGGLGTMVLLAHAWTQEGVPLETLKLRIEAMAAREKVFFLVNTLEYLYRGGRIGGASRLFGSLLQIKPILTIQNGRTEAFDKVRTYKQALQRMEELTLQNCRQNPDAHLTISHCDNAAEAENMADRLASKLGLKDIPIRIVPPAIVVHAGPGIITTSSFTKAS
jgi:DegV family protein with EDD domain